MLLQLSDRIEGEEEVGVDLIVSNMLIEVAGFGSELVGWNGLGWKGT